MDLSYSIPSGDPSFIFSALIWGLDISISTLSFIISGGFIPIVKEVGVDGEGSPKRLRNGNPAFFAFQSHKAISIAAYAHGGMLSSLLL